ncbi:MAG: hypothetical protein K0B87_00980 [Candidatus Syntrophosphaera sp.]|nr:hypothetical protein [Candidatus Syntrophosphaera sp.]
MKPALLLLLFLALALALALLSCGHNSTDEDETRIRDIIYDISRDFNWNEIDGIMEHVHPDYLHNGMYDYQLRLLWLDRLAQYDLLSCEVSRVDLNGDLATVHMLMTFEASSAPPLSYSEPETHGDTSFFLYDQGQWRLYGNQLWGK